jgi:alkylhydroperoxidase family enzyme
MSRIQGMAKPNSLLTALAFRWSQRRYGKVLQPLKVAALDGNLLFAFGHMEWAQQRARTLPREVKHLARTLAAMQVNCPWCLDFGLLESQERGLDEEKLQALLDYQHSPLLSKQEVLVLRYAEGMSQTPVQVPDDLFVALKAHYTDRQLVELTFLIAWEQCVARFNRALGIEADGVSGKQYCLVPEARVSSGFSLGEEQK